MKNKLLMTTAVLALIAGTGLTTAQDRKEGAAPSPAPAAQQNAPAEKMAPPAAQRGNDKAMAKAADKAHGGSAARPDAKAEMKNDTKSSSSAQAPTSAGDKKVEGDMKSSNKTDMKAHSKSDMKASDNKASDNKSGTSTSQNSAQTKPDAKSGTNSTTSTSQTTTGQGAAGARSVNLSSEQKTTIKTVIKEQKVAPVTNVNFSISVGTRIPREVRHHPLPARIVEVYPAWRGFEYILVRDEILVIDPNTLEIVAIIEA